MYWIAPFEVLERAGFAVYLVDAQATKQVSGRKSGVLDCQWIRELKKPFCSWIIMQRRMEMPASHGPKRFSFLYLCADGVAAFQALYVANGKFPAFVAVIQPGTGPGGLNWTGFGDPKRIFARSVLENPAGRSRIFLYGGMGMRDWYRQPCWPDYSERFCFLERADGNIGVWQNPQQPHSADDATRRR